MCEYNCTIACYGTVAIIFLIVTVNMEYHIIVFYRSLFGFSDFDRFCTDFVYSIFCWVLCSLSFYPCQRSSCCFELYNLPSFAIATHWDSNLWLGIASSTGNPHICRCGQNMFFYNCQTRKQLLIILLYHQSFNAYNVLIFNTCVNFWDLGC